MRALDEVLRSLPFSLERSSYRRADAEAAVAELLANPPSAPPSEPDPVAPGEGPLPDRAPRLIGIAGLSRAGKDVVADGLVARYAGTTVFTYSDAIIGEVDAWARGWGYRVSQSNKAEPAVRHLLQVWGDGRRDERADYWTVTIGERIRRLWDDHRLVLVTGLRAPEDPVTGALNLHDLDLVTDLGGTLWYVDRPGLARSAAQLHPNDRGLARVPRERFDAWIVNREGDLDGLRRVDVLLGS